MMKIVMLTKACEVNAKGIPLRQTLGTEKKMRREHSVLRMPRGHFSVFALGAMLSTASAALSKGKLQIQNRRKTCAKGVTTFTNAAVHLPDLANFPDTRIQDLYR